MIARGELCYICFLGCASPLTSYSRRRISTGRAGNLNTFRKEKPYVHSRGNRLGDIYEPRYNPFDDAVVETSGDKLGSDSLDLPLSPVFVCGTKVEVFVVRNHHTRCMNTFNETACRSGRIRNKNLPSSPKRVGRLDRFGRQSGLGFDSPHGDFLIWFLIPDFFIVRTSA